MGRGQTTVTWLRTLSQSSAMLANVSEVHFFFSPVFFFVSSILSSSLLPLSFLSSSFPSSSSALSVIVRAKILSISFAEVSKLRSAAYVNNGWRRTELSGTRSLCFLDLARSPAAAQRSTSAIGRWILSPAMAKSISASIEKVEDELSDPARASAITDYTRYIFPTDAWTNVSCTLPGVALLVNMKRMGKSSHNHFKLLLSALLSHMKYWIEWRCLLQITFSSWWSINMDNLLVDIIVQTVILTFLELLKKKGECSSAIHFFVCKEQWAL